MDEFLRYWLSSRGAGSMRRRGDSRRAPFRMPVGEWVFRHVFLRAPGRAFLAIGVRAADHSEVMNGGRMATPVRALTTAQVRSLSSPAPRRAYDDAKSVTAAANFKTAPNADPPTLDDIAARVAALEEWRDAQQRPSADR